MIGPRTSLAAARRATLREAIDQIQANVPGALAGRNPEYLHQLRVGARRLRAALRVFRAQLHRGDRRTLVRTLRDLAAASGPARDWDVNSPHLPLALREAADRRRRTAHARLRRALRAFRLGDLPRAKAGAAPPLPALARETLAALDRKALRLGAGVDWGRAAERHALRIRLRRLRYACEFLAGAFQRANSEPLIESLKNLQDLLGGLNDLEVSRRLLRELGATRPRRVAAARERALIARLPGAWRRFTSAPRFWKLGSGPNFRAGN